MLPLSVKVVFFKKMATNNLDSGTSAMQQLNNSVNKPFVQLNSEEIDEEQEYTVAQQSLTMGQDLPFKKKLGETIITLHNIFKRFVPYYSGVSDET